MKRIFSILLLALSLDGFSQNASADLAVAQPFFTDMADVPYGTGNIPQNQNVKLWVPVLNNGLDDAPGGTFSLSVNLGSKISLVSLGSSMNTIFSWSSSVSSGITTITGASVGLMPNGAPFGFGDYAVFTIKGSTIGSSTISVNLNITNGPPLPPTTSLSDGTPANNNATLGYTVIVPLPVSITKIDATRNGCSVDVNWSVEEQLNVSRYEVEVSKDGRNFGKVTESAAQNITNYKAGFVITAQLQSALLYVRVKVVDRDGSYKYSQTRTVSGTCEGRSPWVLYVYPNPVTDQQYITIAAKEGVFNGSYKVELYDNSGKLYQSKQVQLANTKSIRYDFNNKLGAGQYTVRVINTDGTQTAALKFEKM